MAEADRVTNYLWVASYDAGCSETDRGQTPMDKPLERNSGFKLSLRVSC